jgi:rod shape-determining protein MreD
MTASLWRKLDSVARKLVPFTLTTMLLFAGVMPLHNAALQSVAPSLPVIAVFYWTLHRPALMPVVAVFVIGLLNDVLVGLPIGVSACVLVCVHAAVSLQRRFFTGKSFGVVWLGFAVVAAAALVLGWLLSCLYYGTLIDPHRLPFQLLTTVGCFPVFCWLLLRCSTGLVERA